MDRPPEFEKSFLPGTETVIEAAGPRPPLKVVFEDDGETGGFYALDLSQPEDRQIINWLAVYDVGLLPVPVKPHFIRIQWAEDGGKAALFVNGRASAVFDFDHQKGYSRAPSPMPATSPWPRSEQLWDDRAMSGIG
ncbi:MAG TPA: DUF2251 domain-containing protein [Gemmatimonadales bacterium]|nr:DUF2251 domain-containing protein [Gemmatimonadales bacterium]